MKCWRLFLLRLLQCVRSANEILKPIYIALGANVPAKIQGTYFEPAQSLGKALNGLQREAVRVIAVSRIWSSPSWPDPSKPPYVNAAAQLETSLSPTKLLELFKKTERIFGRADGEVRNAPRPLDLDILDYRGLVRDSDMLSLPHPRMNARGFVLAPLSDIAPAWHDPVSGLALWELIARLPLSDVEKLSRAQRLAL